MAENKSNVHYERIPSNRDGAVDSERNKLSKFDVDFRPGSDARHCEICKMFRHGEGKHYIGTCTAVRGPIHPQALCDYFELDKAQSKHPEKERADGGVNRVHYERVPLKSHRAEGGQVDWPPLKPIDPAAWDVYAIVTGQKPRPPKDNPPPSKQAGGQVGMHDKGLRLTKFNRQRG